jgi:hypothetical protein
VPLPIPAEVDAPLRGHRQPDNAVYLFAIADAAVILASCGLLGKADQVGASDVMVVADLSPTHAAEE